MRSILPILLLVSLLLLGCTGGGQPQAAVPTATPGGAAAGGATATPAGGLQATASPQGGQAGALDSMSAVAALGMPYHCKFTMSAQQTGGAAVSGDIWVKGKNYRTEYAYSGKQMKQVLRDNVIYMWVEDMAAWLKFEVPESSATPEPAASQSGVQDMSETPITECAPDAFGDDKFATPGTVKSLEEMMGGLGAVPSVPAG